MQNRGLPEKRDSGIVDHEAKRSRSRGNPEMPVTIYGIPNCDTTKKARAWLTAEGVPHDFHDYKVAGIDRGRLKRWAREVGWEVLLNRAGTTFCGLPESNKQVLGEGKAIDLMLAHPSLIKRPVLDIDGHIIVGFKPEIYESALGSMRRSTSSLSRK